MIFDNDQKVLEINFKRHFTVKRENVNDAFDADSLAHSHIGYDPRMVKDVKQYFGFKH